MARYVFDIEANGLLPSLTTIHSLVLKDIDTGEVISCDTSNILVGLDLLRDADLLIGHNIIGYDIPALQKIYEKFRTGAKLFDTLVVARLIWPEEIMLDIDMRRKMGNVPGGLRGRHKLNSWGHRLGEYKIDFMGDSDDYAERFAVWTPEMQEYCEQDVEVTHKLYNFLLKQEYSERAIDLELEVKRIIFRQEQHGICFNEEKGHKLYAQLVQLRLVLERTCQKIFSPWYTPGAEFTPKRDNEKLHYTAGATLQKITLTEFNPGSRDHIIDRLIKLRGWKPAEWTDSGKAKMDEAVLSRLPYPEAKELSRFWTIQKRISQLAEGPKALLKKIVSGSIFGEVNTCGAVTRRASHHNPNLGQVPKVKVGKDKKPLHGEEGDFGYEFRDCFYAPPPFCMVGVDASGLELRMLGHYLGAWDGGEYARQVVAGDPHQYTADLAGVIRDIAKTLMYALLYGAGDGKLGKIVKGSIAAGKSVRGKLLQNMPALDKLIKTVKLRYQQSKTVKSLDKGIVHLRSEYAALNTLLQSAGAIVCKDWMVRLDKALVAAGFVYGRDYAQVLWVHDEFQFYVVPSKAQQLIDIAKSCIRETGESFGLRVPLDAEGKIGQTWAETH